MLLLCPAANATTPMESGETVILNHSSLEVPLLLQARTIQDPEGKLMPEQIMALPSNGSEYKRQRTASFGFSDTVYWFSITVNNQETTPLQRLLVLNPSWLDDVQLTVTKPDGSQITMLGGDNLPFTHRDVAHRNINFQLSLEPGQSHLLIRTQTRDPYLVNITLWDQPAFFKADSEYKLFLGFIYGVIIAMMLYNLVLFLSVREKVYAAYVSYLLFFLVMHATYNGHLFPLLWPDSPDWGNWAHSTFIYLFIIAGLLFAIHFLELKSRQPRAYKSAKQLALAITGSFIITALIGGYTLHVITSIVWVIIYAPLVLVLGLVSLRSGNRAARFFLTAAIAGFIGSFITALTVSGVIQYSFFTYHAVDFGMIIDAVLLSLALADRLRLARAETEQAKAQLLEATRIQAKELENTVAQRTSELMQANITKDKFFSIVAHDLRGPVGSLNTLFNDVLRSPADLTPEILSSARVTAKNTHEFLDQLLTWARSQKGEIGCHPESIDLNEILKDLQKLYTSQANSKKIELTLVNNKPYWVHADLPMVQTVLRNLISNALKFTPQGGAIHARLFSSDGKCLVQITDTGVGIAPEAQQKLFRLDAKPQSTPGTQNEPGTGLGLILCAEFVYRNNGSIGVTSIPEEGSTFWFTLPDATKPAR